MNPDPPAAEPADPVRIELLPLGEIITAPPGSSLHALLFEKGVEFPCGGLGRCRGCRIRLVEGELPVTGSDQALLTPEERDHGWRLACGATANGNLRIELAQWEAPVLIDNSTFSFTPRDGRGVAVDLGTTTIVAQLIDLQTAEVLAVRTALNAQAKHGADIVSRIEHATHRGGQATLERIIRRQVGDLIANLPRSTPSPSTDLIEVVLVGNTAMHHLFSGIDVTPLAHHPFESGECGLQCFEAGRLGWKLPGNPTVRFLPCLGGFVGSDVLVGILATRLHEQDSLQALVDLGTNGEIVVGNRDGLLAASTAAGPAFEGARISMGMRAATGAISGVRVSDHKLECEVLGNVAARGICGSGLVDAVASGLDLRLIEPSGRLAFADPLVLSAPVALTQGDLREVQLAKGAIAAGLRILTRQLGASPSDLTALHLAGAFGNYIDPASARRIGLLSVATERVHAAGNTALLGAKLALFADGQGEDPFRSLLDMTTHQSLGIDPHFQDIFVEELPFPT